jgi:hypothetical protein
VIREFATRLRGPVAFHIETLAPALRNLRDATAALATLS